MGLPNNVQPRSRDEWLKMLTNEEDKASRQEVNNVLKDLGYRPLDFLKKSPEERVEIIMKHQEEDGGSKKAAAGAAKTGAKNGLGKTGSTTIASTPAASKGKLGGLGGLGKKGKAAAEEPAEEEKAPAGASDSSDVGELKEMILGLAGEVAELKTQLAEATGLLVALTKDTHFVVRVMAAANEELSPYLEDSDTQENLYGQLVVEGKG